MTQSVSGKFNLALRYNELAKGAGAQFNGNISEQEYTGDNSGNRWFTYGYNKLDRMTAGQYNANNGEMSENLQYDKGGNITTLTRGSYGGLNYTYANNGISNQLQSLSGFVNGNYGYDPNGNVSHDGRVNVDIAYNYLNLPQSITGSQNLSYVYDATGRKLRKVSGNVTTDYINAIQYTNNNIDFVQTEEGRAIKSGTNWSYEYTLTDHLGNSRVNIDSYNGAVRVTQEDEYYPFGLDRQRYTNGTKNKYLYNKKELQDELGQYDYGARFYDPVIARFTTIDPLAEIDRRWSPYNYTFGDPIRFTDPDGMWPDEGDDPPSKQKGFFRPATSYERLTNPFMATWKNLSFSILEGLGVNAVDDKISDMRSSGSKTTTADHVDLGLKVLDAAINIAVIVDGGKGEPVEGNITGGEYSNLKRAENGW